MILLTPFYIQLVVDEAIGQGDVSLLTILLLGFAVVYGLATIIRALREWVILTLGESLTFQLGGNVVRHLIRLPLAYFERRHVGDLMSRISSIQPIQALLTKGIVSVLIDSVLLVTTLTVMVLISVPLTAIVVAVTLVYLALNQLFYPTVRRYSEEEILARANEETFLMESMRAIRAIKLHGHEATRESGWRNRYAEVISATYRRRMIDIRVELAEGLLFNLSLLLTVYIGAVAVMEQRMTIGLLLAFLAYRSSFTASATALIAQLQKWRLLGLHLERLADIVGEKQEQLLPGRTREGPGAGPALRVEGLTFAYGPTEPPIFEDLNLEIPSGSLVAITGPSGCGKTTLLRVLLGLLQPSAGKIAVDGVPLGPPTLSGWRARIGAVMQDDYLLSGTLADNIAFFDPHPNQSRIETSARLACIHDDIQQMPMAYQSLVSDMGVALSSGQRQRILLARALYRDPDALFLDEGTSHLDEENEARIVEMIAILGITRIVISHRPAIIQRADFVLHFEHGRLIRQDRQARGGTGSATPIGSAVRGAWNDED